MENKLVILNKYETIEKCINRIKEEYEGTPSNLEDYRRNDAIILNLQRACQAVMDIATYIVSTKALGMPHTNSEAFEILYQNHLINKETLKNMKSMIGFRNIARGNRKTFRGINRICKTDVKSINYKEGENNDKFQTRNSENNS